jgi:undecaprenyl-diphosphatase
VLIIKLEKRLLISLFLACLSVIGFVWIAHDIGNHHIARFDTLITAWVQSFNSPVLTFIMKTFTFIGSAPMVIIITIVVFLLLLLVFKFQSEARLFIIVVIGAELLDFLLKNLYRRTRPTIQHLVYATGYSFPSGHSMSAMALYGIVAYILWRHIPVLIGRLLLIVFATLMIMAIGISRIYLGVHFPSDVLGAFLVSGVWLLLSIEVHRKFEWRRRQANRQ